MWRWQPTASNASAKVGDLDQGGKQSGCRGLAGYWGKVPRQKVEKSSHNVTTVTNCHQHRDGYRTPGIIYRFCSPVICDAGDREDSGQPGPNTNDGKIEPTAETK